MAPTVSQREILRPLPGHDALTSVPAEVAPLLDRLLAAVERYDAAANQELITRALVAATLLHGEQSRKSGEAYIYHPVGTALNCAELQLDSVTIAAALLHDVVEDTGTPLEWIEKEFGAEIAMLVDGVTKLTKMHFTSQEEEQAENFRKLIVAMAGDIRVILIKLSDRLHNVRTLGYLGKQKQIQKAKETLEVYAPLAHRLGIYSFKWQLEDLSFAILHPRKYAEIQQWVAQRRVDREGYVDESAAFLNGELAAAGIGAEITGRAKHFYSIYLKMARGGKEFNEIFDLTALRVVVRTVKDCYGAIGIIHSVWKPIPGRFKDYIAMPKFNMYQSLHTTVMGPEGKPLEIQVRTNEMHQTAEFGIAAHWLYKEKGDKQGDKLAWLRQMMEWQSETGDPRDFMDTLRIDLFEDEVFVFTPKGDVKSLPRDGTPIDLAYAIHTDVGNHCVGAKVNGRIVPLHHRLRSGDIVEIITSKSSRGPSRDWLGIVVSTRARQKIRQYFRREEREDAEHSGRELLTDTLRRDGLPAQKLLSGKTLLKIVREMGYQHAEDLYMAVGSGHITVKSVLDKVLHEAGPMAEPMVETTPEEVEHPGVGQPSGPSSDFGIAVEGMTDIQVRMAKCCKPIPGDEIVGYISLGKGVTIHRSDCKNARALSKDPERFTSVSWAGLGGKPFRVEIQIEALHRPRLLEDVARTLCDSGSRILAANVQTLPDGVARERFTIEVGDIRQLDTVLANLRLLNSVYDAYRVVA
jgi:GTP diphosphokinase / guanosine-3',5'-bis(diphosphate) 3'-diphosphatase